MSKLTDFGISVAVFIVMFLALATEHYINTKTIEEQHNTIYQQESKIDDLKYQIGQCHLLQANYSGYED